MLCYVIKTWGSGGIAPLFLLLTLDGGERSGTCPCHFTAGERSVSAHRVGGWRASEPVWTL
jgi:hypothetical protein